MQYSKNTSVSWLCCKLNLVNLHRITRTCGRECCREEREEQEARENEEKELQLLKEIEDERRKQREHATEQVRQAKVSVGWLSPMFACFLMASSHRQHRQDKNVLCCLSVRGVN